MRQILLLIIALLTIPFALAAQTKGEPVRIGVSTSLTGDAATYGTDIKNALNFANAHFFNNQYSFIFEDDQCDVKLARSVAQKLINVDRVQYVLGLACNNTLLATAPAYQKAGVTVITSSATSGDELDIGDHMFRLFPADQFGAYVLYDYVVNKHQKVGLLTEENDYPVLMERAYDNRNATAAKPLTLLAHRFAPGNVDFNSLIIRLKASGIDGLIINTNSETPYVNIVKQVRKLGLKVPIYTVYFPASNFSLETLGKLQEGVIFANTPLAGSKLTKEGREIIAQFEKEYGPPQGIGVISPMAIDSLRMLDQALQSGQPVANYLRTVKFKGLLGELSFDQHGAVTGFDFELQQIKDGKVVRVSEQ